MKNSGTISILARALLVAGGFCGVGVATVWGQYAYTFTPLGDLPGGTPNSQARAISSDGTTVVGWSGSNAGREAFVWTAATGMIGLGNFGGEHPRSDAFAVSSDGAVIVGEGASPQSAPAFEAFRWTSNSGMFGLGHLPAGDFFSHARGVSADGAVVVGNGSGAITAEAFRWTAADGMVGLGFLPGGGSSTAFGVSADGSVVVGASGTQAFRWTSDRGMMGLGFLSGATSPSSYALAVSADGSAIVGMAMASYGAREAFLWTSSGGMTGLGNLVIEGFGYSSVANGVSGDGAIVVGTATNFLPDGNSDRAFIWDDANGMRSLSELLLGGGADLSGWALEVATDVSADGNRIVGYGTNPAGNTEAWLVSRVAAGPGLGAVPEPSTYGVFGAVGLLGVTLWRQRKAAGKRSGLDAMRLRGRLAWVARLGGRLTLLLFVGAVAVRPARALDIDLTFIAGGQFSRVVPGTRMLSGPPTLPGGGSLQSVVAAAAEYWESAIHDPGTLRIDFGWQDHLGSSGNALGASTFPAWSGGSGVAVLQFDLPGGQWFADATPFDTSEYLTFEESWQDFGGGALNTGLAYRGGTGAAAAFDLFSVALHEIGHALGVGELGVNLHLTSPYLPITDPRPYAGSMIPLFADFDHLDIPTGLMFPAATFAGRELPSDADILAVAEARGWSDLTLRGVATGAAVPEPASMALVGAAVLMLVMVGRAVRGWRVAAAGGRGGSTMEAGDAIGRGAGEVARGRASR